MDLVGFSLFSLPDLVGFSLFLLPDLVGFSLFSLLNLVGFSLFLLWAKGACESVSPVSALQEFAIRKRMGIKELQQGMMSEVITQGQLHAEQADWLMKEHKKQQDGVHRMYDEEISRQRMVLEEKLARRRALAQASVSVCVSVCLSVCLSLCV